MTLESSDSIVPSSDRIKHLNEIDSDIVKLPQTAASAVKGLTHSYVNTNDDFLGDQSLSLEQQKQSFAEAASSYFTLLSSLDVRIRRQISALEEADILPTEASNKEIRTSLLAPSGLIITGVAVSPKPTGKGAATGGGLGGLDVGWLNSRNDHVGKNKEADLWEEAHRCVERTEGWRIDKIQRPQSQSLDSGLERLHRHVPKGSAEMKETKDESIDGS